MCMFSYIEAGQQDQQIPGFVIYAPHAGAARTHRTHRYANLGLVRSSRQLRELGR